jgi:RecJ-like exonuclease
MRLKFCGDLTMSAPLRDAIACKIMGEAITGTTDLTARAAVGIAAAAIMQATTGPICDTCQGTGTVITPTEASDCRPCRGTGRLAMTQDRAAGIVGVSVPTYAKKYEREVNRYVSLLESYESRGLSHVRLKVRG